jgi:hypothetical protein
MANEVKRGNMTPEAQARSAEILTHVGHMLSVLANPDDKMTYSIIKGRNGRALIVCFQTGSFLLQNGVVR